MSGAVPTPGAELALGPADELPIDDVAGGSNVTEVTNTTNNIFHSFRVLRGDVGCFSVFASAPNVSGALQKDDEIARLRELLDNNNPAESAVKSTCISLSIFFCILCFDNVLGSLA